MYIMSDTFEDTLSQHETLYNLIKHKEINTFVSFPAKNEFSEGFIDWLSPMYHEAFLSIYQANIGGEKEAKIVKLLNSPWFCNKETEDKILALFVPKLKEALATSETLANRIQGNSNDLEIILNVSGGLSSEVLTYFNKAILSSEHEAIKTIRKGIVDNSLTVCEALKKYKVSSGAEYTLFIGLLEKIKYMKMDPEQSERYQVCIAKSQSSMTKYKVVGIIVGAIALLRLLAAMFGN